MVSYVAYHRTHQHGVFSHSFYITSRPRPAIGEVIYIISGDKPKKPHYFLEGKYLVKSVETTDNGKRRLSLQVDVRPPEPLLINHQTWFDNSEFHNFFTSGQSMNPVRPDYEIRFDEMLRDFGGTRSSTLWPLDDALNDIGSDLPDRVSRSGLAYSRDPKIRQAVKRRAGGKCEFCGEVGFICTDGTPYVECHHIIALAKDGADRMTNVIALCPTHHREAHFGERSDELEKEMAKKVLAIERRRTAIVLGPSTD